MQTRKEKIMGLLKEKPGLTDREITNIIDGESAKQQSTNQMCNNLNKAGIILRNLRHDGLIGNYLNDQQPEFLDEVVLPKHNNDSISIFLEDEIKLSLQKWLSLNNWKVKIKWGKEHGIDIEAQKDSKKWAIEVKGIGSYQQMTANYFDSILGEILKRINDPNCKYSIALPDITQNRNLWKRFPDEAKRRTKISLLLIDNSGNVNELN